MSDSIPTSNEATIAEPVARPTPLAEFLRSNAPALELRTYQGAITPLVFDDANQEAESALRSAAAMDLGWLARIAVTGKDRARWLSGMTTNAVKTLVEGTGNYSFVLNAQGRIQGDIYTFQEQDRLVLETSANQVDRLTQHLDHFIIMDDVELAPLAELTALGVVGPSAAAVLSKLGFDAAQLQPLEERPWVWNGIPITVVRSYSVLIPRFELWFAAGHVASIWTALLENGCRPCGLEAVETLRIVEGIPAYGIDIQEKHLAQETSQTRALNFSKGCYLGQEIVERIRSRANIHRALRAFALQGATPAPGAELRSGDKAVGNITSVATLTLNGTPRAFALGTVRLDAIGPDATLEYDGGTAAPLEKPPEIGAV
ncbi:MAG TPA: hypothetical protein VM554_12735 [Acidisarcina sp.]|nr:hypothetical protein [Acidisarcina sp.]